MEKMINTTEVVFDEDKKKLAEFIAYLTDRVFYFDKSEKKALILEKSEIYEHIRKANAEEDTLKAMELLESAKNVFESSNKLPSSRIVSKSVRVPGDAYFRILAKTLAEQSSGRSVTLADSMRDVYTGDMSALLACVKDAERINKEKFEQLAATFTAWTKGKGIQRKAKKTGVSSGTVEESVTPFGTYESNFSNEYKRYAESDEFYTAVEFLSLERIRKQLLENGLSEEIVDTMIRSIYMDFFSDPIQSFEVKDAEKNEFLFSFSQPAAIIDRDFAVLEQEIDAKDYQVLSDILADDFAFNYCAPIIITEKAISFKDILILPENRAEIRSTILEDIHENYHVQACDQRAVNLRVEETTKRGEYGNATNLAKQALSCQYADSLADWLADSLLDAFETSKVATFTMPFLLLGLFEASRVAFDAAGQGTGDVLET